MFKYKHLIILLALLPVSSIPVSVSASTDRTLDISGNGDTAELVLKKTKENGKTTTVSDFKITAENVLQIEQGDSVDISGDGFTKARIIDVNDKTRKTAITDDGRISFAGYSQGTYVLDVIVDNDKAYQAIIVIGPGNKQTVNKQITKVNNKLIIEIDIDVDCGKGFVLDKNGFCVPEKKPPSICYFDPDNKACDPIGGKCPPGFGFNENDRCIPHGKCPDGYGRADDDETGTCYKIGDLKKCPDGSVRLPSDNCPRPYTPESTPEPTPTPTPPVDPSLLARSQPQP